MTVEKYYNASGEVAVIYSPGYGAAWSTWAGEFANDVMFDRRIVDLVLNDERSKITDEFMESLSYTGIYIGNPSALEIKWLTPGTLFYISEDNGAEEVILAANLICTA